MADSSARNFNYNNQNMNQKTEQQPQQKIVLNAGKVPISRLEKFIIVVGSLLSLGMMFLLVSATVAQTSAQHDLANIEQKISSKQSSNTDLRQEIGEMTSTSRMNKIARQEGLSSIENNLRNVR
ncbi:cell division protein FtsL [Lactobacillus sp.]|uniref:cell division protein FtsL n=1 Tax=Lactobacillus sp. TaxID=1591 RepID=UPI0019B0813E|nr:cell division protein FtsL [Lactobacillus sp.]MBD5430050.1 cell division protein FtsL [Lactobacillus sp.]